MIISLLGIGLVLILVFLFDSSKIEDPWQVMIFGPFNRLGRNTQKLLPSAFYSRSTQYMNHVLIRLSRRDLEKNKMLLQYNKLTSLMLGLFLATIIMAVKRCISLELMAGNMCFAMVMWMVPDLQARSVEKKKMAEMTRTFPEFLLKYIILVEAGINLDKIYRLILENNEAREEGNYFYMELEYFIVDLDSGIGLVEAAHGFSHNTRFSLMNKFSQIIIQSHQYGGEALSRRLSILLIDTFETEKKQVKARCEEAITKLVLPTMLIMISIMLIVIFPGINSML